MYRSLTLLLLSLCSVLIFSCAPQQPPSTIKTVASLDLKKYMGTWYELARLPNRFEEGLTHVKAQYYLMDNGKVHVTNSGVDEEGKLASVSGRAFLPNESYPGHLALSFVPPYCWFYASYDVIYIDTQYQFAIISGGSDGDLLWFLARDSQVAEKEKAHLIELANSKGFDTSKLIWVEQGDR